tara:strand:- start:926 stop:1078 length:153 start_codon:yes stop_codon:yes gene_type:complete
MKKIQNALYDIHEYADILLKNNKSHIAVNELAELILERVDFIRLHLGIDE